jgi:hypothetical protein
VTPTTTTRLLAAVTLLVLGAPTVAIGQEGSRQTAALVFDEQRPAQSTGLSLAIDYANPDDPAAKPPAVQKVVVELPPGTVIDDTVPERCGASNQELMATGPGACPAASVVGSGEIDVDTGVEGPARVLQNDVTILNNEGELILLLESKTDPPRRLVARSVIEGETLTTEVAPTPGGPPDGFAAIKRARLKLDARSTGEAANRPRSYVTTPATCPAGSAWTTKMTFTYRDGGYYSVANPSPCVASTPESPGERDAIAPGIRLRGVPRARCTERRFTLRVRIADKGSGLRRARLSLDGRRVFATGKARFARRIRAGRLDRGRHRLTVVAVDATGNRAVRTARFRRC